MDLYRVEKDGLTCYVQPDKIQYYADQGYRIYRYVEEQVTDVDEELAAYDNSQTAHLGGAAHE